MRKGTIKEDTVIGVLFATRYLCSAHGIDVSSRSVRRWVAAGLISGFYLKHVSRTLWFMTYAAIDAAVQAGRIPPRRGNPNWIKEEGEK